MPKEKSRHRSRSRSRDRKRDHHKRSSDNKYHDSDRDRERERKRDRDRDAHGRRKERERERSRSRERQRSGRDKKEKEKVKEQRRRSPSSSSSSSSSSSNSSAPPRGAAKSKRSPEMSSIKLLQTLEERRLREQQERQRVKEQLKANETPEEKRARRLREKQAKEQRRRQRMGWDNEYQTYSNEDNPFGDSNLTSTFHWGKKLEVEGLANLSSKTVEVLSLQKQLENRRELEKVKKRRQERELERQAREDDAMQQQRSKEAVQFREWQRQEDQFHLEQARLRSEIRIRDGRAKPIDLLAQYVSAGSTETTLEDALEMQMHEPYMLLHGLHMDELEDLLVDIKVYEELEQGRHMDFWNDMVTIVQDELQKQLKQQQSEANALNQRRDGIHQSVVKDVADIFRGKNAKQLDEMRGRIEAKISGRADGVDISYWESLLSQLKAHMARARLRDRHQALLREKLSLLKRENDGGSSEATTATAAAAGGASPMAVVKQEDELDDEQQPPAEADLEADPEQDMDSPLRELQQAVRLYQLGNYSPSYMRDEDFTGRRLTAADEDNVDGALYGDSDDEHRVRQQRLQLIHPERIADSVELTPQEQRMRGEARKGMQGDEAEFSVETTVDAVPQLATDKYRPRKPRYFNRVHTGFEWNKYNQTHYDMDNPPPKIVQGYKFNIFYPDLMDKSQTPQYFLTPCADNADFAVLRFHTGPPYEDIAFKIVNREWEFSYKRGFRCQFHNNIFQLWFHFKRYRYRR
ncbi:splicing factor Cactin [Drosophila sulfurigaster albostrigata]|uniref:splicing factor Cactin n=1 Tax=Drosophila sulfurigaster albostrigata TaxID=89887 RepID=UPI002D21C61E|nr:splicing factor Cactin [Drosophila sulfurigaster albostrigata]